MTDTGIDRESLAKRRVPCLVAYLSPFRIVDAPDSKPWSLGIEDVNGATWDYVELHRLAGGVDVGLPPPYHMVVSRDGAVGLPPLLDLRGDQAAVEFINRCFAALLLGRQYCEAIGADGLDVGSIIDWTYLRTHSSGSAGPNQFHRRIRLRQASSLESIRLMDPRTTTMGSLASAMSAGRELLEAVPPLGPEFLLKGTTGLARRDWGAALSNLWIVVEQITSHLWETKILAEARMNRTVPGRLDQLSDTRTWTVAARLELLYQIGVVEAGLLGLLTVARRARNALAHTGRHPAESDATAAYSSALALLQLATSGSAIPLMHLDLSDHTLSDPFLPSPPMRIDPVYWMEIPKLPGEAELERLEAAVRHNDSQE